MQFSEQCFTPLNHFSLLPPTQLLQKTKSQQSTQQPPLNKRKSVSIPLTDSIDSKRLHLSSSSLLTHMSHHPHPHPDVNVADHIVPVNEEKSGAVACIHIGDYSRLNCSTWESVDVGSVVQARAGLSLALR